LPAYRLPSPHDRTPLQRRASGFALALGVNIVFLFVLLTLGVIPPLVHKPSRALIVDLIPESHNSAAERTKTVAPQATHSASSRPVPKPPPIVIASRPTITPPHQPAWIEMSKDDMAASDVRSLARAGAGSGSAGDSEEVGRGPHGEVLYAAEWAREPTDAELNGYMPKNWTDGFGLVACKTIAGDRVEDCSSSIRLLARASPARCARPRGSSTSARRARAGMSWSAPGCASASITKGSARAADGNRSAK
jgi:protein TonB